MIDGASYLLFIIPCEGIKTMKLDKKTGLREVASQIFFALAVSSFPSKAHSHYIKSLRLFTTLNLPKKCALEV